MLERVCHGTMLVGTLEGDFRDLYWIEMASVLVFIASSVDLFYCVSFMFLSCHHVLRNV